MQIAKSYVWNAMHAGKWEREATELAEHDKNVTTIVVSIKQKTTKKTLNYSLTHVLIRRQSQRHASKKQHNGDHSVSM